MPLIKPLLCALLIGCIATASATLRASADANPLAWLPAQADLCAPDARCEAARQDSISDNQAVYTVRCDVAGLSSGAKSSENAFCSPAALRLPWSDAGADASLITIEVSFRGPFVSLPALSAVQADEHDTPLLVIKWDPVEARAALGPATADALIIRIVCPLTVAGHPLPAASTLLQLVPGVPDNSQSIGERRLRHVGTVPSVTSSRSLTKTISITRTPSKSPSRSHSSSSTISHSRTPSRTASLTKTSTTSPTPRRSATPTTTITRSPTAAASITPTVSITKTASLSRSTSRSLSSSLSSSVSVSSSPSPSVTQSMSPTMSDSPSATVTLSASPSSTPTVTVSVSLTATVSDSISITPTISDTTSVTPTITASVSISPTISDTASVTPTITASPSPTPTISATPSATPSPLVTLPLPSPDPTYVAQGPYLQAVGATSLTIMWRPSSSALTSATVFIGPYVGTYTQSFPGSIAPGMLDVVVSLSGLTPSTRYFYAVCGTAQCAPVNASMTFTTSPTLGSTQPVRIYAIGDMGGGNVNTSVVLASAKAFMGTTPPNMWLFLGDDAYNKGTDSEYSNNLIKYFAADLPHTPLWTTPGNHDSSSNGTAESGPYFARFKPPQGGEAGGVASNTSCYYSFDCGMLHVISLASVFSARTPGSPMLTWLQADLAAVDRNKTQWIVAFWHHPVYSKGTHSSDIEIDSVEMRASVLPILEQGGVDVVLNGHSHAYERSYLVNGSYGLSSAFNSSVNILQSSLGGGVLGGLPYTKPAGITPLNGIVAVTTGGGSHLESSTFGFMHPAMVPFPSSGVHGLISLGSSVIDVTPSQLTFTHVLLNGTVADSFIINKV